MISDIHSGQPSDCQSQSSRNKVDEVCSSHKKTDSAENSRITKQPRVDLVSI